MDKDTELHFKKLADPIRDVEEQERAAREAKETLRVCYPYSKTRRLLQRIDILKRTYDPFFCTKVYSQLTLNRIALISPGGNYLLGDMDLSCTLPLSMLTPLEETHIFHGTDIGRNDLDEILAVPLYYAKACVGYVLCVNPFAPLDDYEIACVEFMGNRYIETICCEKVKENEQFNHFKKVVDLLSKTERRGLILLAKKAEEATVLNISQAQFAKEAGITRSTIVTLLKKLVSAHIIEQESHGRAGSDIWFTDRTLLLKALSPFLQNSDYLFQ